MRKQSWPIWGCAKSWIVVFKNQLYWKAFDQEGFSHGFPILRTSIGKNFVNCIFLRWLGFQCEKEYGCLQAVRRIKLNRLDVRRAVMWKIPLFFCTLSIVLYCMLTIWTFLHFQFLKHSLICRQELRYIIMPWTVTFLETSVLHFSYCVFQTLSHDAR